MVLTQKNRGPSAARNKGLDQASGTYIAFADADDVCEARWLEKMLDAVKGKNCELAMCSWVKVNSEGEEMTDDFPRTLDLVDPVQFIPLLKGLGGAVWNKLFRRDIIERENIRFDPSKLRSEDFAFVLEYLVHVKRIALVSERLYRYRMMEQSLSHISDKGRLYLEICAGQYDALDQIQQKADPRLYGELVQYVVDTNINGLIYLVLVGQIAGDAADDVAEHDAHQRDHHRILELDALDEPDENPGAQNCRRKGKDGPAPQGGGRHKQQGQQDAQLGRGDGGPGGGRNKLVAAQLLHDEAGHAHPDAGAQDGQQPGQAGDEKDLDLLKMACQEAGPASGQ